MMIKITYVIRCNKKFKEKLAATLQAPFWRPLEDLSKIAFVISLKPEVRDPAMPKPPTNALNKYKK